ncbi:hypothetical protein [Mycobacterium leprae]|uniref:hypothetical protein n=1 Tax=Mycobacterium leprae TaxID=1769 RepID=UPI0002F667F9|nr:hypothetical protein [Mycobacterium leprae]
MVGIFAVVNLTKSEWFLFVMFPVLVLALVRFNRQYRAEAPVLEMFHTERSY